MSKTHDILIVVDCESIENNPNASASEVINMFASDDIILDNSQGSNELSIKVNADDSIRWRTISRQIGATEGGDDDQRYNVLIAHDHDWENHKYLKKFTGYDGAGDMHIYESDGCSMDGNPSIKNQYTYRPYVEATATLSPMDKDGVKSAYTFSVNIYKGKNDKPVNYSWDPFVTIYHP